MATHTGMTAEAFGPIVKDWMAKAKHPRFDKPYPQMVYQPMLEVMKYLRDNGYRTYIVTGGGQDFVRSYAQQVYGIPPEQIIGSALDTQYEYNKEGQGVLMRDPKLLLNNNGAGKAEDIYLFIGKRPHAAFGNSDGDRQMLEYTQAAAEPRWRCWYCTMTRSANTPMVQPRAYPTPKSAPSLRACTTRPRQKAGPSSA